MRNVHKCTSEPPQGHRPAGLLEGSVCCSRCTDGTAKHLDRLPIDPAGPIVQESSLFWGKGGQRGIVNRRRNRLRTGNIASTYLHRHVSPPESRPDRDQPIVSQPYRNSFICQCLLLTPGCKSRSVRFFIIDLSVQTVKQNSYFFHKVDRHVRSPVGETAATVYPLSRLWCMRIETSSGQLVYPEKLPVCFKILLGCSAPAPLALLHLLPH